MCNLIKCVNFNLIFCNKYSVNIKLMVLIISAFKSHPVSVLHSNQLTSENAYDFILSMLKGGKKIKKWKYACWWHSSR